MKLKKLLFALNALFLVICISSCDKDNDSEINKDGIWLPSIIVYNYGSSISIPKDKLSTITKKIEYDSENRISKINTTSILSGTVQDMIVTTIFVYNGDNIYTKTTRTDTDYEQINVFEPKDFEIMIDGAPTYNERYKIRLDDHFRVLKYHVNPRKPVVDFKEFTYDVNGSAISIATHPWQDERIETSLLLNDELNGVFRNVKTPAWYLTTQLDLGVIGYQNLNNNCIKTMVGSNVLYEYKITYNTANYPTKIIRNSIGVDNAGVLSYEIEYIKAN